MPLNKYGTFINARIAIFQHILLLKDVVILDCSTSGHAVYNYGHLSRLFCHRIDKTTYSTHFNEYDLALGRFDSVYQAIDEIKKNEKSKFLFLMPTSLNAILGTDIDALIADIKDKKKIDAFTISVDLNDDFYKGEIAFYSSLLPYIHIKESLCYNLIGDEVSHANQIKHQKIKQLLKNRLNIECLYDSLDFHFLSHLNFSNRINIITSQSALPLAKELFKKGIPFVFFNSLDKNEEEKQMKEIAKIIQTDFQVFFQDNDEYIKLQFKNVVQMTQPQIVAYLNIDHLMAIKSLFNTMNIPIQCYATHKNQHFPFFSLTEFIDQYASQNVIILSNERVQKYCKKAIAVEYLGLDYQLLIPNDTDYSLKEGGYLLLKQIINLILLQ